VGNPWANDGPENARRAAIAALYEHAAALAVAGDLTAARVIHEAIGKLLDGGGGGGNVVDLNGRRPQR
jgi:hypothetical protein